MKSYPVVTPSKTFTNGAAKPVSISLSARCDVDTGIVQKLIPRGGGMVSFNEDSIAEATRMWTWAETTFVGKHVDFFNDHRTFVGVHVDFFKDLYPYQREIVETLKKHISNPGVQINVKTDFRRGGSVASQRQTEAVMRQIKESITSPRAIHSVTGRIHYPLLVSQNLHRVSHYIMVGTFWESRVNPGKVYKLIEKSPCHGHTHVSMQSVTTGKTYPQVFRDEAHWNVVFNRVSGGHALRTKWRKDREAFQNTHWMLRNVDGLQIRLFEFVGFKGKWDHADVWMRDNNTGEQIKFVYKDVLSWEQRFTKVYLPHLHKFVSNNKGGFEMLKGKPLPKLRVVDETANDDETAHDEDFALNVDVSPVQDAVQKVLDSVPFNGTEASPKIGETYQRVNGKAVFTVVAVTREDFNVHKITLETGTGTANTKRYKAMFRNHAQWLAKWRPTDSDGKVKEVVFVDIYQEAAKRIMNAEMTIALATEADKEAIAEVREAILTEGDHAVRWIRIIGRELDNRVPGWRDHNPPGVLYDDLGLIVRAIRKLAREKKEADQFAEESKKHAAVQLSQIERLNKRIGQLEMWNREMLYDALRMFKAQHGIDAVRLEITAAGYTNPTNIPLEEAMSFVRRLRERSSELIP